MSCEEDGGLCWCLRIMTQLQVTTNGILISRTSEEFLEEDDVPETVNH